ncbi:MAG TPA: hypothetical protein VF072_02085 [Thermoleophilaceae bacterium]
MSKRGVIGFAVVFGAALAVLIVIGLTDSRSEAFTLGVRSDSGVVKLRSNEEVCQRPIETIERFDGVRIQLGTYMRPGSPFSVDVRSARGGERLARARVGSDWTDSAVQQIRLSPSVPAGEEVAVCIRNAARQPLAVYGSSDLSNRTSTSYLDGRRTGFDLMLVFLRPQPKSTVVLLPSLIRHASLFHGSWASPALYWVLLAIVLVVLCILPALAVRAAFSPSARSE